MGLREGEGDIGFLFHLFIHSLVASFMCPEGGSNPQPWHSSGHSNQLSYLARLATVLSNRGVEGTKKASHRGSGPNHQVTRDAGEQGTSTGGRHCRARGLTGSGCSVDGRACAGWGRSSGPCTGACRRGLPAASQLAHSRGSINGDLLRKQKAQNAQCSLQGTTGNTGAHLAGLM